jgi:adenylosuccinate synthase
MKIKNYQPVYQDFKGWGKLSKEEYEKICKTGKEFLPNLVTEFISFIEDYLKIPVYIASFGPQREWTIELIDLKQVLKSET